MPSVKVIVKWSGKKYDLELNTDEPVEIFKSQIYTLTEVSPDRQKLLYKGLILKDDSDLNTLNIKEGHTFMMMGTIGELPSEPPQKTLFIEDMSDRQKAETLKLPSGFINLGNTCYMNATLQCLRAIPELQESLNKSKITSGSDQYNQNMALSLRELYNQLNQTTEGYPPSNFLETLRTAFPQFAQRNSVDGYMQQDADECWSQIISSISDVGLTSSGEGSSTSSRTQGSFVEQYMTGEYTSILKCIDNDALDEEPGVSHETFNKLNCHISTVVDDVMRGITEVLDEVLLKNSPTLNREAKYSKKSRISRLPSYLTVHFVRFFWKSQQRVRSKILRKVRFPFDLDVTDLCTDELKKKKYHRSEIE
jgi:ubiquitin carboxyl-terminal hydrolase 14